MNQQTPNPRIIRKSPAPPSQKATTTQPTHHQESPAQPEPEPTTTYQESPAQPEPEPEPEPEFWEFEGVEEFEPPSHNGRINPYR